MTATNETTTKCNDCGAEIWKDGSICEQCFHENYANDAFDLAYQEMNVAPRLNEPEPEPEPDFIETTNEISVFFHCGKCLATKPDGISPRDWKNLEVGWTRRGLQVWCVRHNCNVIHIDFEGMKHPANWTSQLSFFEPEYEH